MLIKIIVWIFYMIVEIAFVFGILACVAEILTLLYNVRKEPLNIIPAIIIAIVGVLLIKGFIWFNKW